MIWYWNLSATLGWAHSSAPGSWIKRLDTAESSRMACGSGHARHPEPEECSRPLGSIHRGSFRSDQSGLLLCNPGMLVTWQPVMYIKEQEEEEHYVIVSTCMSPS